MTSVIIPRYLIRLILLPFMLISFLLTILLLAEVFANVLTRALGGFLPSSAVLALIGLQVPALLLELIPGAFFLASVLALSQLSASTERVVFQAVGFSDWALLRWVAMLATGIMLLMWLLSLWLAPWAARQTAEVEQSLASRPAAELLQPGEFANIGFYGSTLYARGNDPQTGDLTGVFVAYMIEGERRLISAERARVERSEGKQFLTLIDGEMLRQVSPDHNLEKTQFTTLQMRLDSPVPRSFAPREALTMVQLWASSTLRDQTHAQERLMMPFTLWVFAVWAMTLTRYRPRMGHNAAILPAVLVYVAFMYLSRTINVNVYTGVLPLWANYWWLQALFLALGLVSFGTDVPALIRKGWRHRLVKSSAVS